MLERCYIVYTVFLAVCFLLCFISVECVCVRVCVRVPDKMNVCVLSRVVLCCVVTCHNVVWSLCRGKRTR